MKFQFLAGVAYANSNGLRCVHALYTTQTRSVSKLPDVDGFVLTVSNFRDVNDHMDVIQSLPIIVMLYTPCIMFIIICLHQTNV